MAPRKTDAPAGALYQVSGTGVVYLDGNRVHLNPSNRAVYPADHPLVRKFPGMFKEVEPVTGRSAPRKVEQATAAPGETRDVAVPEP